MSGVLILAGPTGIGKTDLALALAAEIPAEIVAVDSMQVYRGMDMGTGKPSEEIRRRVPHHGIDLAEPETEFDVQRYVDLVSPAIAEILRRGRWAILTAGCGLYLRVLLRGICEAPGKDPEVRGRLLEQAASEGSEALHGRLAVVDRQAAARIHPNDLRRVVRALEVFEVTGRPMTRWWSEQQPDSRAWSDCRIIGLTCDRGRLYERIEARIDSWLDSDWLDEARVLSARRLSLTAREALGYRELYGHLEGRADWASTRLLIHQNTRRYAKRQLSWFRHEPGVHWMNVQDRDPLSVAQEILVWKKPFSSPSD